MTLHPVQVANPGLPRVGPKRELKTAPEAYWAGKSDAETLLSVAADLRARSWARQEGVRA